jgi:hypothetical protein
MLKPRRMALRGLLLAMSIFLITAVFPSTSAFAFQKEVCTKYFCNDTEGAGEYIHYVTANKLTALQRGSGYAYGFFEVYGPNGLKKTGPTTRSGSSVIDLPDGLKVKKGGLICLRFFERVGSAWKEIGPSACTTSPI